ncbi:hypothetical protein F3Y22_tig00110478pilonHSYRG00164 [Hibiscus syriacus]|uniref:Zinc finger PHD-type domain-containing protein n=1 Tax=Hibiscus syriacus TaxID=106335 RepID=A0A6A3AEI1_HIBSY|nr:hypothetical protein F3Y22_tig00110478pilonHSYRG00164 [Hibiscus syriacus]
MSANFPISFHSHPLLFIPNHNDQVKHDCSCCKKSLSGPIYHCPHCSSESKFKLHKKCGEVALEIDHSYELNHPLTLLPKLPAHPEKRSCNLCKIKWDGFVYSCSLCDIDLSISDFVSPTITDASHDHPWRLVFRKMSFMCDFCDTAGDRSPYLCTECNLLVHKKCISLPRGILITRHHHGIYLSYSLRRNQVEDWTCRICYNEVDMSSLEAQSNLITDVKQIKIGEQMVASEIRHAYHIHNLTLAFSGEINNDIQCDGCMRPIPTPYYSCDQCKFFLHKDCAELPRTKRHPFHKHLLTLTVTNHIGCATQPLTAWYKYDKHALTLTHSDDSDTSRLFCDLCENERRPNDWFYCCDDCDNSLHSNCAIGDLPYIKLGNKFRIGSNRHERPLQFTFLKNIWNCPPCKVCGELCNGQALKCKELQRNFSVHWGCRKFLGN